MVAYISGMCRPPPPPSPFPQKLTLHQGHTSCLAAPYVWACVAFSSAAKEQEPTFQPAKLTESLATIRFCNASEAALALALREICYENIKCDTCPHSKTAVCTAKPQHFSKCSTPFGVILKLMVYASRLHEDEGSLLSGHAALQPSTQMLYRLIFWHIGGTSKS